LEYFLDIQLLIVVIHLIFHDITLILQKNTLLYINHTL
jgi:hypothetical protein